MIFVLHERRFSSAKNANAGATARQYLAAGRWKIALNGLQITLLAHFPEQPTLGDKDRQRHPLYLTVFWFRLAYISKNRQKYRQSISYQRLKLARRLTHPLCISISYESARET